MRSVVVLVLAILVFSVPVVAGVIDGQDPVAAAAHQRFLKKNILARWNITEKNDLQIAHAKGIDILEETPNLSKGYFTVFVTQDQLDELQAEGRQIDVLNYDWYGTAASRSAAANGGFRTYFDAIMFMDSISTNYSSIAAPAMSIGTTIEGNPIYAMKISDNPGVDEPEPEILFTGMHHAREPIGLEINLETIRTLVTGYGVDPRITQLIDEREIWFIPCVNIDGYEYNVNNFPPATGMWRKNRRNNGDGTFGVDLNRNYGYQWGYDDVGSDPNTWDDTYRGTAAFSEPETQAIRAFVNAHNFVFMVNYHSYGDWYIFPWGYEPILTPDHFLFSSIGDSLATYNGYRPVAGVDFTYPTNGDSDDWAYGATGEHNKILSYTPEVGDNSQGFWPPEIDIPSLIAENLEPNLIWIDLAANPDRIYKPEIPLWTTADTVGVTNFDLTWADGGTTNPAVSYSLEQLQGPVAVSDDAESVPDDWSIKGFFRTTQRSASPTHSYYSQFLNASQQTLTATEYYRVQDGDSLMFKTYYDIELDWDYAYAEVSTDGGLTFATLPGNLTTNFNPNGNNRGNGITGFSGGTWTTAKFDLSPYLGQDVIFRISYVTDAAVLNEGIYIDDIEPLQTYTSKTALLTDSPSTTYPVTGAANGDHLYRVSAKDEDGQTSPLDVVHTVTVAIPTNGDMDDNLVFDAVDINLLISYVFFSGPPAQVPGAEECNGVLGINVLDIVHLIDFVFRNGPPPLGLP